MEFVQQLAEAMAAAASEAGQSLVAIGRRRRGLGVVIGEGRVLTNAHNLRDVTTTVTFHDGRTEQGRLAGVDADGDLAVLEVETSGLRSIAWEPASPPQRGSVVLALGHGTGTTLRTTAGLVSAVDQEFRGPNGRRVRGALEHTAPLGGGSSGGPLLTVEGRLVGINTNRLGGGFYLALPADAALKERVDALGRGESVARPRLGVGLAPSRVARRLRAAVGLPERDGVLVQHVAEGGPAARAGVRSGDLLVAVDDTPLTEIEQLLAALDGVDTSATLRLAVVRGVDELELTVHWGDGDTDETTA